MNILSTNKNIRLIKKVLRQDYHFSTRLPYADKVIRELYYSLANSTYKSTEHMINKLQSLKGKTKSKCYQNISNFYDKMKIRRQSGNFHFQEDPFSENAQGIGKNYHEVLLLMNFLKTKPKVKNVNINYYDLCYAVIKNGDIKEIVNDKYEDNENDFFNFNDIVPNHYIGTKINIERLR